MKLTLLLFVLVLLFISGGVQGRSSFGEGASYGHYADNEPIKALLGQFAAAINTPIVVSDKVEGAVSGNFKQVPAREFIDSLSRIYGLIWYFDGQVLYVYDSGEVATDLIYLDGYSPGRLQATLSGMGVLDERYPLTIVPGEGIVMLSGPPRYLELVSEVAAILISRHSKTGPSGDGDAHVVEVFELKHAWADDRTIVTGGEKIPVPGIASTLRAVFGSPQLATNSPPKVSGGKSGLVPKPGLLRQRESSIDESREGVEDSDVEGPESGASSLIVANERLNAVIVHDRQSRMPLYQALIASLDRPRSQIEIEVSIVDVSTDRLEEVGFEWQINSSSGSFANADFSGGGQPRDENDISFVLGDRASFTSVLTNSQDLFLARIRALSEEGDASVLSQPTILTLDNIEAVVDNSTTFFVRLVGENEVDLFPVSAGTVLRVTPHIVDEGGDEKKIHLDINIEDGQQTGQAVDDIPVISTSVITTEAVVGDRGSLLVGGYYFNQDSRNSRKVPILGDIPLVGRLFRSDDSRAQQRARLFLISPRIVTLDGKGATDLDGVGLGSIQRGYNSMIARPMEGGLLIPAPSRSAGRPNLN